MFRRFFFAILAFFNFHFAWTEETSKAVLVTGGAGYIGTQTCKALKEAGFFPIAYDNLTRGYPEGVQWGRLEIGDLSDRKKLIEVIDKYRPIAVIHIAALKSVGESVKDPAKYYLNNVSGSIILLDVMREKGLDKMIFSSSAAIYGTPSKSTPLKESDHCCPINPYGTSKWVVEKIIDDFKEAYGLQYVALRYFNVAGADLKGECGERNPVPINLIPIILQVAEEKRKEVEIFGFDYPTADGSAIRDYLHVVDLADAHVKALQYLIEKKPSMVLNLGTGKGASVKEIVKMVQQITKCPIPVREVSRRVGDPPILTADFQLAKKRLGWEPRHSDLVTIIESEWNWVQRCAQNQ